MNILLAHSFYMHLDPKQREIQAPYPPLGTIIAASQLREAGHEVSLFDAMLAESPAGFEQALDTGQPETVVFFEDNFNWLSKMCLMNMRKACFDMIGMARTRNIPVYAAGSDPSDVPGEYLEAGADAVIKGEAEFRLTELLSGKEEIPGVYSMVEGKVSGQPPLRPEKDLSRFAPPAWDLVDIEAYRQLWTDKHGYFSLNMTTTRGCPYGCNWCAKPIHGRRYDMRSAKDVARELSELKTRYRPDHIWFTDDIFGLRPQWVEEFANEVEALNASVPFKIQARADLMGQRTVDALKKAGCKTVWMGVESGSQKILDAMDKGLQLDAVYAAAERLHRAGIQCCFFLQFGYPGEDASDIRATWEMVRKTRPDEIGISVSYPLPHTPFFNKVKDHLEHEDHWLDSHFMRPVFKATYPADFYPELYQYFHQLFARLRPGRTAIRRLKDAVRHQQTLNRLRKFNIEGIPF